MGAKIKMIKKLTKIIIITALIFIVEGCQNSAINHDIDGSPGELVATLNGYEFYRESLTCEAVIGDIIIDGYDFGFFGSACDNTLNDIGYVIKKDGYSYHLQDLVDEGILATKDIYEKVYILDPYRKGK